MSMVSWTWVNMPSMANCTLECIKHSIASWFREVIVHCLGAASSWIPCAVWGVIVQRGYKTIRECPKKDHKDGECSKGEDIWGVAKTYEIGLFREEETEGRPHWSICLPHEAE